MGHYDHRVHAGNAGDVWKHFLLLEAADCLLDPDGSLVYAESHVGRPDYSLRAPGDWEGGIGKIWPLLPSLRNFCYFDILADLNPKSPSSPISKSFLYPGSARLIYELARRKAAKLEADVWDNDPDVAISWKSFSQALKSTGSFPPAKISFHRGDGFAGVLSRLSKSPPGLLFIDPPYINPEDVRLAEKLLHKAREMGWIVLWWYMMEMKTVPCPLLTFELHFAEAGLDGGRWKGAVVALAGPESERFEHLIGRMHRQKEKLIRMLKLE
ncbi:MAG: 23S rRNA (adenine(2030)-N(6))-methyltransferase RlmJ [Methanotrichaceae archaeon]|nr:23S rRNA (adenine(2030)-N(6))-methyltransferase RlmJ [Methanotrichaceae archaeon]